MAGRAGNRRSARFGARAAAVLAALHTRHLDLGVHAENSLFERQFQVVADVFAPFRAAAPLSPSAGVPEDVAEAEEIAENVAEIDERVGARLATLPAG